MTKKLLLERPNNNCVLSFELLMLLRWFVEQHPQEFKKLIKKAVSLGFERDADRIALIHTSDEILNQYVVQFFSMLETLLTQIRNDDNRQKTQTQKLLPAVNHVDITACDALILDHSVKIATRSLEKNPKENPHEVLFRELLRQWNPKKDTPHN